MSTFLRIFRTWFGGKPSCIAGGFWHFIRWHYQIQLLCKVSQDPQIIDPCSWWLNQVFMLSSFFVPGKFQGVSCEQLRPCKHYHRCPCMLSFLIIFSSPLLLTSLMRLISPFRHSLLRSLIVANTNVEPGNDSASNFMRSTSDFLNATLPKLLASPNTVSGG